MSFDKFINEEANERVRWETYTHGNPMLADALKVLHVINAHKFQAYIVGGAVRDIVLGKKPKDIDIATNMPMEIISKAFPGVYDIGKMKDFGLVVVKMGGHHFEVAQFRKDGTYSDGRRPDSVQICQTFEGDAARRDFCINAMGIDAEGNIIDYFDGMKDIKNKVIRTVGNPHDRFAEDYLRMMRVVRFGTRLGFNIHPDTKAAVKAHSSKITQISAERIKDELFKMASQSGDKFAKSLVELDDVGILSIILPEIAKMKDFQHNVEQHPEGGVFHHTLSALRQNKLEDPIVNLAILFHDLGKIVTYAEKDGRHTYYGHAEEGVALIEEIAKRLKMSNDEKDAIMFAMVNHMNFHSIGKMKPSKVLALLKHKNFEVLKAVAYADAASRTGLYTSAEWESVLSTLAAIETKWGSVTANRVGKMIDGQRVMSLTGLKPGKEIGHIIKLASEIIVNKGITSDAEIDQLIKDTHAGLTK